MLLLGLTTLPLAALLSTSWQFFNLFSEEFAAAQAILRPELTITPSYTIKLPAELPPCSVMSFVPVVAMDAVGVVTRSALTGGMLEPPPLWQQTTRRPPYTTAENGDQLDACVSAWSWLRKITSPSVLAEAVPPRAVMLAMRAAGAFQLPAAWSASAPVHSVKTAVPCVVVTPLFRFQAASAAPVVPEVVQRNTLSLLTAGAANWRM
jgi:hypothetical protein